ncbi:MAG: restriction endonuclease subunit S [Desulfuromonadales bacterium]|nr:restriction endonuclease subunit S [Desulfuromonadales bacterium]
MKIILKEIASIQVGYSFRSRLESMSAGEIAVIQMKDLTGQNRVDCDNLVRVDMENPKEHHLVRPGDLVFRSRGLVTTSAILSTDPGKAMVAAPLFRIRTTHENVVPEYLNWFINQAPAQAYLASHARGTAQQMISKEAMEALEVVVPALARQRAIVELASMAEQEQDLIKKIAEKRWQYISTMLLESTEGE